MPRLERCSIPVFSGDEQESEAKAMLEGGELGLVLAPLVRDLALLRDL